MKKILKFLGITLGIILILIIGLVFSLRLPSVQNFVKKQLISYLEKKVDTEISLEKIYVSFPNNIVLQKLYVKGKDVDTLLFVDKLNVGIYLPDLLKSTANVNRIDLDGIQANINRTDQGVFNFQFILDAFPTSDDDDSESKPFIVNLDKIQFRNIALNYADDLSKMFLNLKLNQFKTEIETFDLQENNYAINSILIDGFKFKFDQQIVGQIVSNNEVKTDSLSDSKPFKINLSKIEFNNFDVAYSDEVSKMDAHVIFDNFSTSIKKIDLQNNHYEVDAIDLKNAIIDFSMLSQKKQSTEKTVDTESNSNLNVLLNKLNLNNIIVNYSDNAVKPTNQGIDFNHLKFNEINLKLENFVFNNSDIKGSITNANVNEKSGLVIKQFQTDFNYGPQTTFLKNLYLETQNSIIRDEFVVNYNSKSDLTENINNLSLFANLPNTKLAFSDILLLAPNLKKTPPFNEFPKAVLEIDSKLNGKVNDLSIEKLLVSGLGKTKVNASGVVKNAMDPDKLWINLKIKDFATTSADLNKIIPKGTVPENIQLPTHFNLKGEIKGGLTDILADLKLQSTFGNADLKAKLNQKVKNKESYAIVAHLHDFNVGKLIKNDSVGNVTASMKLTGKSFDFEKADAVISANVSSAKYNNYTYKNLDMNGKIIQGEYYVNLKMNDPNIIFDFNALGVYTKKNPTLKLFGDIEKVDLYKTGFADEILAFAGKISADFSNLNPDELNGSLKMHDFAVAYKTGLYPISDVSLEAIANADENKISFDSQVFNLALTGKYKLTELATHLQRTVNHFYNLNLTKNVLDLQLEPAFFNADVLIKNDDVLTKFLPSLEKFNDINLKVFYDSEANKLNVKSNINQIIYGQNSINGIDINIENKEDFLDYNFSILGVENKSFILNKTNLTGTIKDSEIIYDLKNFDDQDKIKYEIAGSVKSFKDMIQVALNPDGLKLNYLEWTVNPENFIQISDKGILAHQFEIGQTSSKIYINSDKDIPNSPLNINISNFAIENLTEIIKKDSLLASGIINGTAQINDLKNKMTFISDLNIQKLNVFGSNVGNLSLKVDNGANDKLSANVELSGYENEVRANGFYNIKTESFDLDVEINKLQMKSLQGFSMQMISNAKGFISGNLKVAGNVDKPSILGNLKFNDSSLHINSLNATFTGINDQILFKNSGINFQDFKINDTDGNSLNLKGDILTQSYRDFKFDLAVFGKDFKLVNSANSNDNMIYGVAALDVNLNIKGNLNLPKVNGNLKVTDKTNFTFVMPQYSPALQEREGIIEFVDLDQMVLEETIANDEQVTNSEITGLDVSVNIEVDKDAQFTIVLDKVNNDVVKIQGEAQLTGGIDPSGKTTLVGTYEVNEGSYQMSINLFSRKFEIQKGSTLTFTGEPTKADINITAIYNTKTAPLDLVEQQLNTNSPEELNLYKQKLPFEALLIMKGELMKPEISFNIQLDEDNSNVSNEVLTTVKSKLEQLRTQESELNKQVFALLLLNRFVGENPFESNSSVSAATMARQSVSKLLSQQLNSLASDLIKGVDINIDLESNDDYTTGSKNTRTDLNIGLTKSLFHDRLRVTVGSNFGIEGEGRENEQTNNIAGDVSVEYMLSKNGRYMLKAYRVNEYQVALQGEVVETGVGFIITLQYNKFKEIIRSKKQKRTPESNKNKIAK